MPEDFSRPAVWQVHFREGIRGRRALDWFGAFCADRWILDLVAV